MKKISTYFIFMLLYWHFIPSLNLAFAQIGGNNTYEFLNLSPSARVTALGGQQIALRDDDASLGIQNPALYNSSMDMSLSLNTVAYLAGIHHGMASFVKDVDSVATFGVGIQYISYGNFVSTDPTGQVLGNFTGGEYAIILGGARQEGRLSYGANLKFITSTLESYNSVGLAADLGVSYYNDEKEFGASLLVKNLGTQLTTYNNTKEELPFDVQLGITKKLKHMPFRFSLILHHLHRWDIRYDDPDQQSASIFVEEEQDSNYFIDNLFRHVIFNAELYLGKALRARFGYNHLRRQELRNAVRASLAGFSFGAGLRISKFQVDYGVAVYHSAGSVHHFSISTKLNDWVRRKRKEF